MIMPNCSVFLYNCKFCNSRMEGFQNCSAFLWFSFSRERKIEGTREFLFQIITHIIWKRILMVWFVLFSTFKLKKNGFCLCWMVKTKNLSGYSKKILRTSGGREEVQLLPGPVSHFSIGYCHLVPYFYESCWLLLQTKNKFHQKKEHILDSSIAIEWEIWFVILLWWNTV